MTSSITIKICGITTPEAIKSVVKSGAEFVGFIFYPPSPRFISREKAAKLKKSLSPKVKTVGVFVNPGNEDIQHVLKKCKLDYIQCHGDETIDRIKELRQTFGLPIIKAISVRSSDDIAKGQRYSEVADMLLFDTKVPTSPLPGGNGLAFDWTLLRKRKFSVPWFLSGGLNPNNISEALNISDANNVDVSSSLESEPGIKDPELISAFVKKVKEHD